MAGDRPSPVDLTSANSILDMGSLAVEGVVKFDKPCANILPLSNGCVALMFCENTRNSIAIFDPKTRKTVFSREFGGVGWYTQITERRTLKSQG